MSTTQFSFASLGVFYQRHQRLIVHLVSALIALYLIAFAARVFWQIIPEPTAETTLSPQFSVNSSSRQSSSLSIANIQSINLFGDPSSKPAPVVQQTTKAPQTKLKLTLTGVVAEEDSKSGAAIIQNNGNQNTYGIGDKIDATNATLDEIYSDRVIIKNGLVRETLMLDGEDYSAPIQQTRTATRGQQVVRSSDRRTPFASNTNVQNIRQQIAARPDAFTDFIAIQRHAPNGKLLGYRVSPGKQPAFFTQVGLQAGDIITQINGLDLSDMKQSLEAIKVLNDAQTLQLELLRDGQPLQLDIDMPSA